MDAKRRKFLDEQFVLTIQNESLWYYHAVGFIQGDLICKFRMLANSWVDKVRRKFHDGVWLDALDYAYIEMQLLKGLKESGIEPPTAFPIPNVWYRVQQSIAKAEAKLPGAEGKSSALQEEITQHMEAGNALLDGVQQKYENAVFTTKEMQRMQNIPFTTKSYVFGQDVANMTEDQLIAAIKRLEAEIADLKSVKTKSKKIEKMIADAEEGLKKIVEALDAK